MNKAFMKQQEKELAIAINCILFCNICGSSSTRKIPDPYMMAEELYDIGWRVNLITGDVRCSMCKGKKK